MINIYSVKINCKSISAFAIQQTEVILVQDRLHQSFRKSCPAKGARRNIYQQREISMEQQKIAKTLGLLA